MKKKEQIHYGKKYYSENLKHQICKEHINFGTGLKTLSRKYNLSSHSLVHSWLREYGYIKSDLIKEKNICYIGVENYLTMPEQDKKSSSEESNIDQAAILQLKRELEEAKLLAEAYKRMIEIAETDLKIPIRKKYNTK